MIITISVSISKGNPSFVTPETLQRVLHFTAGYILYNCVCDKYKSCKARPWSSYQQEKLNSEWII